MYVLQLSKVSKSSIPLVGGKGSNLGEMLSAGFLVPQGFCITSTAYDTYMDYNKFTNEINNTLASILENPAQANSLSQTLISHIKSGEFPEEMYAQIKNAYQEFGSNVRVAARSSATAEDLPDASFAGQQETYLNITDLESMFYAVKCCFASLWTQRAISYRQKTGFDKKKISLAIVVQEMIEGSVSGVLFTVNPLNGQTNELMVNASYGLGESIVSGLVTPDTYIINKTKHTILKKQKGSKEISIVYAKNNGTIQTSNPIKLKKAYCLSTKQLKSLSILSQKVEAHYGSPQDIEWTIKDNIIYLLQARPITTLTSGNISQSPYTQKQNKRERMMMNNLLEHCPTPLFPLDYEPLSAVSRIKSETLKDLGIKLTQADSFSLKENGEFKIQNSTVKLTPHILFILLRIKEYQNFETNEAQTNAIFHASNLLFHQLDVCEKENMPLSELLKQLKILMEQADKIIYVRFRYNIFPSFVLGKLIDLQLKKMSSSVSQYDLFSNLHYKTWDMNLALNELSKLIHQDKALHQSIRTLFEQPNLESQLNKIADTFPSFGTLYKKILKDYGWKSTSTYYAFSSISWMEDKQYFLSLLQIALTQTNEEKSNSKYTFICNQIRDSFAPHKALKLLKRIEQFRIYHQNREESLYLLETCYGLCRQIVRSIAVRYPNIFVSPLDILYLTLDEIYQWNDSISEDSIKQKIMTRKQSMLKNQHLWSQMEMQAMPLGNHKLKGISGNRGAAKGTVCIVHNISEFHKLKQGDILVCKYTDPVWTPLFTLAKAVVSDTGGPLSHSAIVAREYDIPAVLGCGNATKQLKDGQEIFVNGDDGVVNILS